MDSTQILVKTRKGQDEVKTRGFNLPQPVRMLLIMIDGVTSMASFRQKTAQLPHAEENLNWLLDQGFVDSVAPDPLASGFSPSVLAAGAGSASAHKHALIELSRTLLEDQAGKVVQRLEEAPDTHEELLMALERCYKLIKLTIDEGKANRFLKTGQDILGKAA
jgi:hypothetical protein